MKIAIVFILTLTLFVSCGQDIKETEITNYETISLNQDPVYKGIKDSPKSIPIVFPSGENKLVGRILMAHGSNEKPTVVFLHGNPGFEKNEETGQILRRQGFNAVFFSYSGTWGNEGIFSYKNSIQDLKGLLKYLKQNAKQFRIDEANIYFCGHSMGADIAILCSKDMPEIKKIISIDPWDGYNALHTKTEKELNAYISNLEQRPCIELSSGKDFVNEIISSNEMDFEASLNSDASVITHIFSQEQEKSIFQKNHNQISENNMILLNACDHSFSDKRIELAKTIIECLK
ncbi:MAG: alpha/beta hydrolase [Bacteroidales bacterium]|nr:alpha/beta hydrolase [Bacteroidales bacterium]